ncbi:MAG: ABC transporter permease [Nocardioides sp.]|nr:ABC transporter permease [Nocardioides sp.]
MPHETQGVDAHLPGTATTRSQMLRRGIVRLVLGLLAVGVAVPVGGVLGALLALIGVVVAYTGLHRVVWAWRRQRVDLLVGFCLGWLILVGLLALLAPVLPLGEHNDVSAALTDPSYLPPFRYSDHLLGTNNFGLDMLARSIYGARTSLVIALGAVAVGTLVGGTIGVVAGYLRGGVDRAVGVATNALLAVPPLVLLITLSIVLEPGLRNLSLALAVLTIPSMVRLARANTITFAQREFVLAARALGATRLRIIARELVPNVALPVFSMAVVLISVLIVAESSLSFLGLGIQQPEPTWGNMISEGQGGVMEREPFIVLIPGFFLFLTVFSFNLLGERAQKRWDPRSAKL